jgi:NAD(P)-dependent dehydrogenase (short-subunit alcohol dehydrogenase family)
MKNLDDKVVAIIGSASGIGRELAIQLADQGCVLALADIDEKGLASVAAHIDSKSKTPTIHPLDVSNREQVYQFAADINASHGRIDILINCAGVAVLETIEDIAYDDFEWAMAVNFWGAVYATKAFLPFLKQRDEAHIVNVSSVDAITPNPNGGAYAAAKAALKLFTETLFQELQGTNISVTSVIPGGVKTNLHRNARFFKSACEGMTREECIAFFEDAALTSAQNAAGRIIKAIKRKKGRVLIGLDGRLIDVCSRVAPFKSTALAGHMSRNLKSKKFDLVQQIVRRLSGSFGL